MRAKKLFAGLVAGGMMISGVTAFAADPTTNTSYDKSAGTVSIATDLKGTDYAGKQMTVIVVPAASDGSVPTNISDEDIIYIDQAAASASENIFQAMGLKNGKTLDDGTYYIKIGGQDITESGIIVEKFTVGDDGSTVTYYYGDVNLSGGYPDLDDATEIVKYVMWDTSVFDLEDSNAALRLQLGNISADRETSDSVDLDDATEIIKYVLWDTSTLDDLLPSE